MLRYYFHINPDELSDSEWAARRKELEYIRTKEKEASLEAMVKNKLTF